MLKFLDGKKTLIGVLITVAPQIIDALGQVLSATGGNMEAYSKITGGVVMVLGLLHKFVKGS